MSTYHVAMGLNRFFVVKAIEGTFNKGKDLAGGPSPGTVKHRLGTLTALALVVRDAVREPALAETAHQKMLWKIDN